VRLDNTTTTEDEVLENCQDPDAIAAIAERLDALLSESLEECYALEEEVTAQKAAFAAICAENAALRQSLAWAINTFQGESGCGDAYWEQFPEYVTACALLADPETQPTEPTP
jgi:hypothetical protein